MYDHIVKGYTLIENKYHKKEINPYNLGVVQNFHAVFGKEKIGWILPLANGKRKEKEMLGLTYYPINSSFR